ncbi:alpha/beta fold hydrolase [Mycobacterium kansasii]|uniref:alpha/beta fold hydrolase n=1 Tax=Mycobacterium kansasii TaxID=1768 RepID=UPI001CE3B021|nr:alpha/beta hydrolase [Mycobacterium kansasii]UCA19868.1 alpha/beta hydrolase [Mycobacterium kansasii]UGT79930.1 alpha/beta hydrolase [Mycobacterium kansasii]UGT88996.1 alpha/beta hydrolase [Mycobacterium kansasii]UGU27556.1 alpha/beta hydrolase [Mycobacterium kansasii]
MTTVVTAEQGPIVRRDIQWTTSGLRLRRRASRAGDLNWLFLPGGPGIGSESLHELVDTVDVPGCSWMVDLPGDGSNVNAPGAPADPYDLWPQVLLEAAHAVAHPVFVGHSTGGEYLLSVPALDGCLAGLALVSTAPDASWIPVFEHMTRNNRLPGVEYATTRYLSDPTDDHLRRVAVESAPWNFAAHTVARGTEILARLPYNARAAQWSEANFDRGYRSAWWPSTLPTLIVSGSADRIVTQTLWHDKRFHTPNTTWRVIAGAGHFPWIEQPAAVHDAFAALVGQIDNRRTTD